MKLLKEKYNKHYITREKLTVCTRCAERETGKKSWKEKNQQIKKLSQK